MKLLYIMNEHGPETYGLCVKHAHIQGAVINGYTNTLIMQLTNGTAENYNL